MSETHIQTIMLMSGEEYAEMKNEITRLEAEVERLRAALEDIIQDSFSLYAIDVARAALTQEKNDVGDKGHAI